MKRTTRRKINNFIAYFNRTYKYKFAVIVMIVLGYFLMKWTGDCGALIFSTLFFGPLFFIDIKDEEEES